MHSKFLSDSNTFYRRYCPVLILLLGALLRLYTCPGCPVAYIRMRLLSC